MEPMNFTAVSLSFQSHVLILLILFILPACKSKHVIEFAPMMFALGDIVGLFKWKMETCWHYLYLNVSSKH